MDWLLLVSSAAFFVLWGLCALAVNAPPSK